MDDQNQGSLETITAEVYVGNAEILIEYDRGRNKEAGIYRRG